MNTYNYYNLYLQNIYFLIQNYNLKYKWFSPQEDFYLGSKEDINKIHNFSINYNNDPYLNKYSNSIIKLGEDLIKNGSLFPFFYTEKNGNKHIRLGKHRIYSLKKYIKLFPNNNREFLFIEISNNIQKNNQSLFYFTRLNPHPIQIIPQDSSQIYHILNETGDFLSHYFWNNKIIPNNIINDKLKFEQWIKQKIEQEKIEVNLTNKDLSHIRRVEIEPQSFCNRTCDWCPNKQFDRKSKNEILLNKEFFNLIYDLKNNNFGQEIKDFLPVVSFIGYQEGLSNPNLLKQRINSTKSILGENIFITSASNGDYLNENTLKNLNLNHLAISDYDCLGKEYWLKKFQELNIEPISYYSNKEILKGKINNLLITIRLNFPKNMKLENRGGFFNPGDLKELKWSNNINLRSYPCAEPTYFLTIAYDGSVMPCCHMRPDNPEHKQYILGNIKKQSIIDIYYSEKAQKFREQVRTFENDKLPIPCKRCHKYRNIILKNSPDGWEYFPLSYSKMEGKNEKLCYDL